jgi:hypothetical protein
MAQFAGGGALSVRTSRCGFFAAGADEVFPSVTKIDHIWLNGPNSNFNPAYIPRRDGSRSAVIGHPLSGLLILDDDSARKQIKPAIDDKARVRLPQNILNVRPARGKGNACFAQAPPCCQDAQ